MSHLTKKHFYNSVDKDRFEKHIQDNLNKHILAVVEELSKNMRMNNNSLPVTYEPTSNSYI